MNKQIREQVFISYSHADKDWLDRFLRMLKPALRADALDLWCDREIRGGMKWRESIENRLGAATIALLLVSDHFLASDFIGDVELPSILKASVSRGLKIYWVPLSATTIDWTPLSAYQSCWPPNQPLDSLSPSEQTRAIRDICYQICDRSKQLVQTTASERDLLRENVRRAVPESLNVTIGDVKGGGDYSVVYRGTMEDRPVAVKVLVDSPLRRCAKSFEKTARLAVDYEHPCFIRIRHVGLDTEPHFLIMDDVEAETVADRLERDGPMQTDEVGRLIQELAEALTEHHNHDLVYGSICPTDVFIDEGPRLRLSAIGISSYLSKEDALKGCFPRSPRTATYIGPEQYYGHPLTQKSDQYALGLFAIELLQGTPPVAVKRPADFERKLDFFRDPAAFAGRWKDRHPALAQVIFRMLQKDPDERWPALSDVANALGRLENEAVLMAKQSYLRHCHEREDFYEEFYRRFFTRCPQAKLMFADMPLQYLKLDRALQFLLNFGDQHIMEPTTLSSTADRHRSLKVTPRDFDEFASALIETLRDFRCEKETVIRAWEITLRPGLQYLKQNCCRQGGAARPKAMAKPRRRREAERESTVAA